MSILRHRISNERGREGRGGGGVTTILSHFVKVYSFMTIDLVLHNTVKKVFKTVGT